eukprot:TRINITY_DN14654_c0_g1_i4.p1 TRINITY_DN14654_c0_g1~~TRINITY_DN14654_c0_g1_i4.p1  ORF type:complete len:309 (+),score=55.75 TRINITY_DN14654_c0_g1_i4:78-1004(+)
MCIRDRMIMTGKPSFRYNFSNEEIKMSIADNSFWLKVRDFAREGFFLGGGTLPENEIPVEYRSIDGRHAYAILHALELGDNKLLLLKDPRGVSEWVGEWSAGSINWNSRMQAMTLQKLGGMSAGGRSFRNAVETFFNKGSQNIFFVSWEEFIKCFEVLFASVNLDGWNTVKSRGEWKEDCMGKFFVDIKDALNYPQYLLRVPKEVEVFCLLTHLIEPSIKTHTKIGFEIHRFNGKLIGEGGFVPNLVGIGKYSAERNISLNCVLEEGEYLVLIAAYELSQYREFDLSLIHICRCRRYAVCRSRWSPYH